MTMGKLGSIFGLSIASNLIGLLGSQKSIFPFDVDVDGHYDICAEELNGCLLEKSRSSQNVIFDSE